jgi:hypothetical protein
MSETAEERKKRLLALREGAQTQEKELKFRNYLPRDEELQAGQVRGHLDHRVSSERRVRSRPRA